MMTERLNDITKLRRLHSCDGCGTVFECHACATAMESNEVKNMRYQRGTVIYSDEHNPTTGWKPWPCSECKPQGLRAVANYRSSVREL